MQIEVTGFARLQLRKIYAYYKLKASKRIASQIVDKLLSVIEELGHLPGIGTIGPNLSHMSEISQVHCLW